MRVWVASSVGLAALLAACGGQSTGAWIGSMKPYVTDVSHSAADLSTTYNATAAAEPCTTNLFGFSQHSICIDESGEANARHAIIALADSVRRARIAFGDTKAPSNSTSVDAASLAEALNDYEQSLRSWAACPWPVHDAIDSVVASGCPNALPNVNIAASSAMAALQRLYPSAGAIGIQPLTPKAS